MFSFTCLYHFQAKNTLNPQVTYSSIKRISRLTDISEETSWQGFLKRTLATAHSHSVYCSLFRISTSVLLTRSKVFKDNPRMSTCRLSENGWTSLPSIVHKQSLVFLSFGRKIRKTVCKLNDGVALLNWSLWIVAVIIDLLRNRGYLRLLSCLGFTSTIFRSLQKMFSPSDGKPFNFCIAIFEW